MLVAVLLLVVLAVPLSAAAAKRKHKHKHKSNDVQLHINGLQQTRGGGYLDPDGRVTLTVVRNAHNIPTKVVNLKVKNANTDCAQYDPATHTYSTTPGPELSVNLGTFKLQKQGTAAGARFIFKDQVRTINGVEHELTFIADDKQVSRGSLWIKRPYTPDGVICGLTLNAYESMTRKK